MLDPLLCWLSFRASGRRGDLPTELLGNQTAYKKLRELSVLGHVETDAATDRWQIVPPVLAGKGDEEGQKGSALLCGLRTPGLLEKVGTAVQELGARFFDTPAGRLPPSITIDAGTPDRLASLADKIGAIFQPDAAYTILAALPTSRNWIRTSIPMVVGKTSSVERFSRSQLKWVASSLEEATAAPKGLFRVQRDRDRLTIVKEDAGRQCSIEPEAGRLIVARGLKVAKLSTSDQILRLPVILRPPWAIEKALTLNTNQLPQIDWPNRELIYSGIPGRTARLALGIMGLKAQ